MIFDAVHCFFVSTRQSFQTFRRKPCHGQSLLFAAVGVIVSLHAGTTAAESSFDLSTSVDSGGFRRVNVVMEVSGDLKMNADGKKVRQDSLRVAGDLRYTERTLRNDGRDTRVDVRHYQKGSATIAIGDSPIKTRLRKQRRLIVASVDKTGHQLYSPLGPLTRDELELIDVQGSTALLHQLGPTTPVTLESQWQHDNHLMAQLLGLDAISQSDVKSTLRQVEGNIAIVDMSGTVSGAVDGVSSDIKLKAKYNIDLDKHQVTWLTMSIREDRAIGHATPGFDVVARIRVAISEATSVSELSDTNLTSLPLEMHAGATLLDLSSRAASFRLLHPREWQVMIDRHDVTVLRMIRQGDLIAQCNISSLPDLPPGERVSLKDFQSDIQSTLGDKFGQFIQASRTTNDHKLQVLRTVVSGLASELPVRWVYYHVADEAGRQAAIVFTMDAEVVEEFAEADRALINSFEFTDRNVGSPTKADLVDSAAKPENESGVNR